MELTLTLDEALTVVRTLGLVPDGVEDVRAAGRTVTARVAVHELPGVPAAVRLATRLAGPVDARVEDLGVEGRTWRLSVEVRHPLAPLDLSGFVTEAVRGAATSHLPPGVVAVASLEGTTRVAVDLDALGARVVAPRVGLPVRVEDVALGERIHVRATV